MPPRDDEKAPTKFPGILPGTKNLTAASTVADSTVGQNLKNPFVLPSDEEVFALRDREKQKKKEAREKVMTQKIWEKDVKKHIKIRELLSNSEDKDLSLLEDRKQKDAEKSLMSRQTREHFDKENLHDFIVKKREMFLVQYALDVKREEMKKLEEIAQAEEQKLLNDEKALEEDAAKFDAFLKENDKNSVEAIKRAEAETKLKLEKVQEIKKLNAMIMAIKSEMSKNEDQLRDYLRYKEFLDKLTPQDWFNRQAAARRKKKAEKRRIKDAEKRKANGGESSPDQVSKPTKSAKAGESSGSRRDGSSNKKGARIAAGSKGSAKRPLGRRNTSGEEADEGLGSDEEVWSTDEASEDEEDEDVEEELFFKKPQQLLDIFAELEENNLSLIQNCQETEETLEELRQKIVETQDRMQKETQSLKSQIEFLTTAIEREEEKAKSLEERAKFFSSGIIGAESQEKLLSELNAKVEEVYRRCIGDNEANISTLQMLTAIENRLEGLFATIEMMPQDKVEQAEKMKDKERRQRLREEKMETQRILQEERVQRALDRARAPVKRKTGKPLVFRSAPPHKRKTQAHDSEDKKEEEDMESYFANILE